MKKRMLSAWIVLCMVLAPQFPSVWAGENEFDQTKTAAAVPDGYSAEETGRQDPPLYADPEAAGAEGRGGEAEKGGGTGEADRESGFGEAERIAAAPHGDGAPQSYSKTLVVSDGEFKDIQAALDSLSGDVGGAVYIQIDKSFPSLGHDVVYSVPTDKGIESLTLGTSLESGITLGSYNSQFRFYANGVPLIIDRGVEFAGGMIFGGGEKAVLSGGTSITLREGSGAKTIYGGGQNSDVTGDISLMIQGEILFLYGGGYARPSGNALEAAANVDGNISIVISGENSSLSKEAVGGGYAYTGVSKANDEEQHLQANVNGTISITLDCPNLIGSPELYGGGKAEMVTTSSTLENAGNCILEANVTGDIEVVLTGNAKSTTNNSSSRMTLWGGGFARSYINGDKEVTIENTSLSALVTGDITVDGTEDFNATSGYDDWDSSMLRSMYGGGKSAGRFTNATVKGSTSVVTSRKTLDSEYGVFGGGSALQGGVARVTGNTSVEVRKSDTQPDDHENAKGVIGGGNGGFWGDATVEGSTSVTIAEDIIFESSGLAMIGGGYVSESNGIADVLGNVTLRVGNGVSVPSSPAVVGAGRVKSRTTDGRANVGGNVTTQMGSVLQNKYIFGAGYAGGTNSSAAVGGDVETTVNGATNGSWVFGGGYGQSSELVEAPAKVSGTTVLRVSNSSSPNGYLLGGGWGSGTTPGGKTIVNVENSSYKSLYGGGYLEQAGDVQIAVTGSALINVFGGGNGAGVNDVRMSIADTDISYLYGGSTSGNKAEDIRITLADSAVTSLYAGGGDNSTANSAEITVLGSSTLKVTKGGALTNRPVIQIGDGAAETDARVYYLYEEGIEKVRITNNAVLTHLLDESYPDNMLFYNLYDLEIEQGGTLSMENVSQQINGDFTGGGTLIMKAGNLLTAAGAVSGETELRISGSPEAGQLYVQASEGSSGGFTLDSETLIILKSVEEGRASWRTVTGIPVAVAETENGTVSPSGIVVSAPGTERSFAFTPAYGYKLGSVKLGDADVTGDVTDNTLRLQVTEPVTLTVQFEQLLADDIHDIVESLPGKDDEPVTDDDKDSILDTKLHFEALPDEVKSGVEDKTLSDLNEALSKLPEVGIEVKIDVQTDVGNVADIPDAHMLLQSMTAEEAESLKSNAISEYKLAVTIAAAGELSEKQDEVLSGSVADKTLGKQYDVTIKKEIREAQSAEAKTEVLTELKYPVTLVFDVADQKPAAGYQRQWSVLNLHGNENDPVLMVLKDTDSVEETVTVTSSSFSVYTLAYQDSRSGSSSSGGGSSRTSWTITAKAGDGGSISPAGSVSVPRNAERKFTVTADEEYRIADVKVDGKSVGAVSTYTFKLVSENHTIEALFETEEDKDGIPAWNPFADVSGSDWFHDSVKYAYEHGLMAGTSANTFSPQLNTSRGMISTILWKLEGSSEAKKPSGFADVEDDSYYAKAIDWAYENGVAAGYGDGNFGPDDLITREQLVTMLYHYAEYKKYGTSARADLGVFADQAEISAYARDTMSWAFAEGLIVGKGANNLDPSGWAARAETAAILTHFSQKTADK